jgi:SAM-dependent methyltransferase
MDLTCAWCGGALDDGDTVAGRAACRVCGVATTTPWPSDRDLDNAYGGSYRPATGRFTAGGDALLRWTRARLARRIERIAPPGRVLDVGAGEGALLDALSAVGRQATGLERRGGRRGIEVKELDEVEGEWAAIIFWHSLEHLRAPAAALERAAALLEHGGVLVVAVPNAASLQAGVFGERWLALDLPRHLVHIPSSALIAKLAAAGLRVERVSYWRGGQVVFGWLHGLVGKLPGDLDLYDAIRTPEARSRPLRPPRRALTLLAGALLVPVALMCAAAEVAVRRGGSVYVEARLA